MVFSIIARILREVQTLDVGRFMDWWNRVSRQGDFHRHSMSESGMLPIALLHVRGDAIEGATRFQKLVFLAQEETDISDSFTFKADKYGPFSPTLARTLDLLEEKGLIEKVTENTRAGHEKYVYLLTNRGHQLATKLARSQEYKDLFDAAQEIKNHHNDKPLESLLKYVYKKYPEKTKNTELDLEELFDQQMVH